MTIAERWQNQEYLTPRTLAMPLIRIVDTVLHLRDMEFYKKTFAQNYRLSLTDVYTDFSVSRAAHYV